MGLFRCRTAAITAFILTVFLAGCESFPVLTQEEYELIVDYSAGVLSKYSTENGDKLTRVAPLQPEEAAGAGESLPGQSAEQTAMILPQLFSTIADCSDKSLSV